MINDVSIDSVLNTKLDQPGYPWTIITAPTTYSTLEDIMVLSTTWYRLRMLDDVDYLVYSVDDTALIPFITEPDREFATKVRDYYGKKLTWMALNDVVMTPFKQSLSIFLAGDGRAGNKTELPMVFRLPEFYLYDQQIDELIATSTKPILPLPYGDRICELQPVKQICRVLKSVKKHEYWFTDSNSVLYVINLGANNPLQHIWDKIYNKGDIMVISGHPSVSKYRPEYVVFHTWRLM